MSNINMKAIDKAELNVYDQLIHKKDKAPRDKMLLLYRFAEVGDYKEGDEGNERELIIN